MWRPKVSRVLESKDASLTEGDSAGDDQRRADLREIQEVDSERCGDRLPIGGEQGSKTNVTRKANDLRGWIVRGNLG